MKNLHTINYSEAFESLMSSKNQPPFIIISQFKAEDLESFTKVHAFYFGFEVGDKNELRFIKFVALAYSYKEAVLQLIEHKRRNGDFTSTNLVRTQYPYVKIANVCTLKDTYSNHFPRP
jgi:hypothetical protein